ncbi:MAG: hypothetical protein R2807_11250 [Chitinophagales bacterium]
MLPELAGADREDEVLWKFIKVVSANATQFQENDYVLAYLPGPKKWDYQSSSQTLLQKSIYIATQKISSLLLMLVLEVELVLLPLGSSIY